MNHPQTPEAAGGRARPAPPAGRPFQPGRSGNPKGAPKRPAPRTADVEWLFSQEFEIEFGGESRKLPLARVLLLRMAERALKGDARATTELLALHGKAEETRAAQAAARTRASTAARQAAKAVRADADEAAMKPPILYLGFDPADVALRAMRVVRPLPSEWSIGRWAVETLAAADPSWPLALNDRERRALLQHLAPEEWPEGPPAWLGAAWPAPEPQGGAWGAARA